MTINETQNEIIEEFSDLDDWMDRYAMIIDLGNSLPPIDPPKSATVMSTLRLTPTPSLSKA